MTPEQQAAYVGAQTACALIELEGMKAENAHALANGMRQPYTITDFNALIERYGIHHNAVCSTYGMG